MPETAPVNPWELRFGARVLSGGGVEFRVWAPRLHSLSLRVLSSGTHDLVMHTEGDGEFTATVPDLAAGADYVLVPREW